MKTPRTVLKTALALASATALLAADESGFGFAQKEDRLLITHGGQPVASYVFRDEKIRRPFFAQVHAPGGLQVTRHHPPRSGEDETDHDTMHPGLWLAFGDLSGEDFWRNKGTVRHERFVEPPVVRDGALTFTAANRFLTREGKALCAQTSRITLSARPGGYLLIWEAEFKSDDGDFYFGDQEEMGLGLRVATPMTEKNGGMILNSAGQKTAQATWGKPADWCDYSGTLYNRRAGLMIMPDPKNFRPSWFHNRDYGLMVANPFGRNAMTQGAPSRVEVKRGESFRLRFGVLIHASAPGERFDRLRAYEDFLKPSRN